MGLMNISELKKGEILATKTWRYLSFTLRSYGNEFLANLRNIRCIANGLGDHQLTKATGDLYDRHIFSLCDIDEKDFLTSLDFFREHESYEWDYPFEHPTLNLHMIVFKIPDEYTIALEHLKRSEYSKMYTKRQQLTLFYPDERKYDFHMILTRNEKYIPIFENKINALSSDNEVESTRITLPEGAELDFSFKPQEEIFNYDESLTGVTS